MSIEKLKEQARRHEQNEEWKKALDKYQSALGELAAEDQVDIGLYNRVGDLHVKVGNLEAAVDNYDQAVDLYREAYLPNNAIAVCKKIIRHMPHRAIAYLRIGQIRAEQGFLPDARTNFLTYAEKMQQAGDLDESFRALIEFCDLAPDDVGVRVTVAEQMAASGRTEEAVEQLLIARRRFVEKGEQGQADALERKIVDLDPQADLDAVPVMAGSSIGEDGDVIAEFGEITFGDVSDALAPPEVPEDLASAAEEFVATSVSEAHEEAAGDEGGFSIDSGRDDAEGEDVAAEVPSVTFDDEDEGEAVELPMMDFEDEDEGEAVELPTMDFDDEDEGEAVELPIMDFDDEDEGEAVELPIMDFEEPGEVLAADDAATAIEEAIEEASAEAPAFEARPEPPAVAETPPAAEEPSAPSTSGNDYVDLGAMILGESGDEKSTRFTVAYEEPTGDEEADFARMLSQFKDKVSENVDSSDVRAHYDLGTAYKEMGLLDEAITSFQAALRASADHLPTYELMGQTFIEMGKPEAAVRSLQRALEVNAGVEDDLVGIYYYLARAHEELNDRDAAIEFYDRVFALDINFADVTERLRELR